MNAKIKSIQDKELRQVLEALEKLKDKKDVVFFFAIENEEQLLSAASGTNATIAELLTNLRIQDFEVEAALSISDGMRQFEDRKQLIAANKAKDHLKELFLGEVAQQQSDGVVN